MLKISIRPQWLLTSEGAAQAFPRLLELLVAIDSERSIAAAAAKLGISYRHAWGLIRQATAEFGAPVLNLARGRRATLSALGEKLVAADRRIMARIAPLLDSLASELEAEIERSRAGAAPVLRIHASHGYAIELLRKFLLRRNLPIELKYRGSMEAVAAFAGGSCELAGLHAPIGELQAPMLAFYSRWLDPRRQLLISLAVRRQGIMVAPRNPKAIHSLADLAQPGLLFVNRQFGSGTRVLLDLLLKREGIDSGRIEGYGSGELTHSAVGSCIASGLADAAFGVEQGARSFGLDFIPIISERYFLLCDAGALALSPVRKILDVLASKHFRAEAGRFAGVDVTQAGAILTLAEAFTDLPRETRLEELSPST
jgi:molybdate transport repressor ModE-like protein